MKPIPAEFQHYFPKRRFPDRPWWKKPSKDFAWGDCIMKRVDGKVLRYEHSDSGYDYWILELDHKTINLNATGKIENMEEALAEVDRLHPLPLPKLRAGQIWSSEALAYFFGATLEVSQLIMQNQASMYLLFDPAGEYYSPQEEK